MTSAVVIPTKNRGGLIARAIESALHQTLPVDEVVVVDDGSTDDTLAIVGDLSRADRRVRLIQLERSGGAAKARNIGVAETKADWICFLDSDDAWSLDKHAAQREAISSRPDAVASFTGLRYAYSEHSFDVPAPSEVSALALRGGNVVGSTSSAMIRRATFDAVGGFDQDLPSCQDWDLWMKLRAQGSFAMVSTPLVTFTQDSSGRISKNREAVFAGHRIVFSRALEGVDDYWQRARIRSAHQQRLAQIMLEDTGEPAAATKAALLSLALRPTRHGARLLLRAVRGSMVGGRA